MNILVVLVGILVLLSLVGFLDRFHPFFEIPVAFRLQYAVVAAALTVVGLVALDARVAIAGLVVIAVNLGVIAPAWFGAEDARPVGAQTVRLLVANVEASNTQRSEVASLVREIDADVVGLIEYTPAWVEALGPAFHGFDDRALATQDDPYAIGLHSRVPLEDARVERFPARDGPPSIVASIRLGDEDVTLVITHGHTPRAGALHTHHIEAIADARARFGEHLVVCGDFNTVPWSSPISRFKKKAGLRDAFEGRGFQWSWPTWNPALAIPIDHCFVSEHVIAVRSERPGDVGSDHRPMLLEIGVARR